MTDVRKRGIGFKSLSTTMEDAAKGFPKCEVGGVTRSAIYPVHTHGDPALKQYLDEHRGGK